MTQSDRERKFLSRVGDGYYKTPDAAFWEDVRRTFGDVPEDIHMDIYVSLGGRQGSTNVKEIARLYQDMVWIASRSHQRGFQEGIEARMERGEEGRLDGDVGDHSFGDVGRAMYAQDLVEDPDVANSRKQGIHTWRGVDIQEVARGLGLTYNIQDFEEVRQGYEAAARSQVPTTGVGK